MLSLRALGHVVPVDVTIGDENTERSGRVEPYRATPRSCLGLQ